MAMKSIEISFGHASWHSPWLVPAVLLLLSVLALGIVWHRQQPPPAFQELRIESVPGSNAGTSKGDAVDARVPPAETEFPR